MVNKRKQMRIYYKKYVQNKDYYKFLSFMDYSFGLLIEELSKESIQSEQDFEEFKNRICEGFKQDFIDFEANKLAEQYKN